MKSFNFYKRTGLLGRFGCHNPSLHLHEHKFEHNFQDVHNPFCKCDLEFGHLGIFLHIRSFLIDRNTFSSNPVNFDDFV